MSDKMETNIFNEKLHPAWTFFDKYVQFPVRNITNSFVKQFSGYIVMCLECNSMGLFYRSGFNNNMLHPIKYTVQYIISLLVGPFMN